MTFVSFVVIILVTQAFCAVLLNREVHLKPPKDFLGKLKYLSFYHSLKSI